MACLCGQGVPGSELISQLTHHMTTERLHNEDGRKILVNAVAATVLWNACVETMEGVGAEAKGC